MNKPSPKAVFIGIINEKDDMKITIMVAATKPHIRNVGFDGGFIYTFLFSLL
jgi:hypothetical protein